ncbi:hypothetical protein Ancab_023987 [Ancistrocladus abbreviatus]
MAAISFILDFLPIIDRLLILLLSFMGKMAIAMASRLGAFSGLAVDAAIPSAYSLVQATRFCLTGTLQATTTMMFVYLLAGPTAITALDKSFLHEG